MANIDDILEQCVEQVMSGRSTLDDCLAAHPQYADVLRPLMQTALDIEALDRLEASPVGFQAGKRLMMEAVVQKERGRAASGASLARFVSRYLAVLMPVGGAAGRLGRLAVVGALGVATVAVWLGVAGLLLRTWHTAFVPQTCVVAEASGIAQIQTSPGGAWEPLAAGWVLQSGHRIRTGSPAGVTVSFFDGSTSSLGPDSELVIAQVEARRDGSSKLVVVQQVAGTTYTRVDSQDESLSLLQIETPSASVMVHGTEFKVGVNPDSSTSVVVIKGEVDVTSQEVTITVTDGQATMVQAGQAPGPVVRASPEQLVEGPTGGEPSPQIPEASATGVWGSQASADTPTTTSEAVRAATATPEVRTPTPRPLVPTATPKPSSPTARPSPSPEEVVEIFLATYYPSREELRVKARTSRPGCMLTLMGFGPMLPEGGHWLYEAKPLRPDDVPSVVTVRSSCGGSGTSPVRPE